MKKSLILIFINFLLHNISFSQNHSKDQLLVKSSDLSLYFENRSIKADYYGLFHKINQYALYTQQEFELKRIDLRHYLPQTGEPNYDKIKSDNLIFVLSGFDSLKTNITGWIPDLSLSNIFPGESYVFEMGKGTYNLYAKGEIIRNNDSTALKVFNGIRDYKLLLRTKLNGLIIDQTISQSDFLEAIGFGGYVGKTTIEWIGDLTGDNEIDIITSELVNQECYQLKLLSSNKSHKIFEIYKMTFCGG